MIFRVLLIWFGVGMEKFILRMKVMCRMVVMNRVKFKWFVGWMLVVVEGDLRMVVFIVDCGGWCGVKFVDGGWKSL